MKLEMCSHLSMSNYHILIHRVVDTDIYREVNTPMDKFGNPHKKKKPVVLWYHRLDKNSYSSYEEAAKFKPNTELSRSSA